MKTSQMLCAAVAGLLILGSPLAPIAAMAQMTPATPPPPPGIPPPPPPALREPTRGDAAGAAALNIVYVPGKAIECGAGTLAGTLLMLLTFGSAYHAAVSIFQEGCAGPWMLTPYDVSGVRPPEER
ncbi:MAG: hypothetical protein C5B48_00255 [Candidatus Rokuibacteriota bacterium]|nr:MAG: hypothetical protein C5B48_00255 [Candidatus Rokubacteria bacterium]